jgi:hypothetical protein
MAPASKADQSTMTHRGDLRVLAPIRAGRPRRRKRRLRPRLGGLEGRRPPASFLVTRAADSGPRTLRDANGRAIATSGVRDEIGFRGTASPWHRARGPARDEDGEIPMSLNSTHKHTGGGR